MKTKIIIKKNNNLENNNQQNNTIINKNSLELQEDNLKNINKKKFY